MKRELRVLRSSSSVAGDELVVPLDDPNEVITEQWQDGLHDWYTCRDAGERSIKSATPVSDCVTEFSTSIRISLSPRGEASATCVRVSDAVPLPSPSGQTARYRRLVNLTPRPSFRATREVISCCVVVPSLRTRCSANQTHIPGISRAPTNGVVGKNCICGKDDVSLC